MRKLKLDRKCRKTENKRKKQKKYRMKIKKTNMKKAIVLTIALMSAMMSNAVPFSAEFLSNCGKDYIYYGVDETASIESEELLPFGNMDRWYVRNLKESKLLGGKQVTLYEVAPNGTCNENCAYKNMGGSPWATSNVYAKVAGVVKTNVSVYKEARPGHGYCAKLYSHMVSCKVLGMVDIEVFAAGSLFLGTSEEPVTSAKNPYGKINFGVPFTKKPKAVKFDYKTKIVGSPNRIRKGTGSQTTVKGMDKAEVVCFLQKRTEDAQGNIRAIRIGTLVKRFDKSTNDWVNNAKLEIHYGDITKENFYDKESMGLSGNGGTLRCAKNSKGKMVDIIETGWDGDATPTHMILQFASSHGGAYVGTVGNTMWVDNVGLVY